MKQRADGRWLRVRRINGKPVNFYSSAKTEKAAIKDIEQQMIEYVQANTAAETFGALSDEWIVLARERIGHKTYVTYRATLEKLSSLNNKQITEIQPHDVQSIINALYAKGFGKTILLRTRGVVSMVFDYAIGKNIRVPNFTAAITIPRAAKRIERQALTDDEINTVIANANADFGLYPLLLMYTGLRRGEALALQWKDIDIEHRIISVTKSIEFAGAAGKLKPPKSLAGIRTVPILKPLIEYLKNRGKDDEYLFGKDRTFSETMIRRRWDKYIKSTGLNITQHQLRHTYATMLHNANIDAKTAQHLLGHSDISTTLNIYTHIDNEIDSIITERIDLFLKNKSKISHTVSVPHHH